MKTKRIFLSFFTLLTFLSVAYASQTLMQQMGKTFVNMPESAREDSVWKERIQTIDIEKVPLSVIRGLVAKKVLPSQDSDLNRRLVGNLRSLRNFSFVVRESFLIQYADKRIAGYAFAIDECTTEECYGFYGLYFYPNGKLAHDGL